MKSKANLLAIFYGVFFLGLTLSGWGFDDVAGYLSHPARAVSLTLMALSVILGMIFMPPNAMSEGESDKLVRRQKLFVLLGTLVSGLLHFFAPYSDRRRWLTLDERVWLRYCGLLIFAAGGFYATYAPLYLGKYFSIEVTIQEGHKLITTGPFSRIRHPRYLGFIMLSFGFALVYRSIFGLIAAAAMTALILWRISDEEKMLIGHFGDEYRAYQRRTGRVFPKIFKSMSDQP
jgi:protein-S-isoprenylcysteine O-methyltransferase Ste14